MGGLKILYNLLLAKSLKMPFISLYNNILLIYLKHIGANICFKHGEKFIHNVKIYKMLLI